MPDGNEPAGPRTRLAARYRELAPPGAAWNPLIDSLLQHRSVRAYLPRPLPPGTLEALVAAAQSAPTSSNLQAWSVVAIQDQERKDRLAALAGDQKHISQAPLFLCWIADLSRAARLGQAAGKPMDATHYLEAFVVAIIDAALAAQNALVAAESLGLGAVYIGGMRNHPEAVAAELGLPPQAVVAFGLCIGYPDPAKPAAVKPRLPQPSVLHHEQYDAGQDARSVAAYDPVARSFQHEQGMSVQDWSAMIVARLGPVSALNGRDKLRAELADLGFALK